MTELDPRLVEHCLSVMRHHARSFSRASRLLPRRYADRVAVLYAFCRLADDAVDLAPDAASARQACDELVSELDDSGSARPVVRAFCDWSAGRPLTRDAARELLNGIGGDVGAVRIADDAELLRYAYRVAGTVGLMMCDVLGVSDPRAHPFAIDLGVALQLTNIARDVAEDAAHDRVYLPHDRLARFGVAPQSVVDGRAPAAALGPVVLSLLDLADRYYASAEQGMRYLPRAAQPAILVAARIYRAIGGVLRRRGGNPLLGRAVVSSSSQAVLALGALGSALVLRLDRTPAPVHDPSLHRALVGLPGADFR